MCCFCMPTKLTYILLFLKVIFICVKMLFCLVRNSLISLNILTFVCSLFKITGLTWIIQTRLIQSCHLIQIFLKVLIVTLLSFYS